MVAYSLRPPLPARPAERSLWIEAAGLSDRVLPPLRGRGRYDVVIIGGGLTGLWTAIRLRELDPGAAIAIVEAEFCGAGASGRNGGQLHSWFESLDRLSAVAGNDEVVALARETVHAIDELAELQAAGTVDMDLRLDGWMWTASSSQQEGAWNRSVELGDRLGEQHYRSLSAAELQRRGGSAVAYQGVAEERAGTLNPAKLTAGLRELALSRNIEVFERSPVRQLVGGSTVGVVTDGGLVSAEKVLLATNAWAGSIPEINRLMYSVIGNVMTTVPIPDRLDELGWTGGEAICDAQTQVLYYQRTVDGRVLFGRGGGRPIYRDRLGAAANQETAALGALVAEFNRVYPSLADVPIDHHWSGPVDCLPSHVPVIDHLRSAPNVLYCIGWNGTALAQAPVVGRIAASLLADVDNDWSRSGLVGARRRQRVIPEPLRFLGARVIHGAVRRTNTRAITNRPAHPTDRLLTGLVPHPGRSNFD